MRKLSLIAASCLFACQAFADPAQPPAHPATPAVATVAAFGALPTPAAIPASLHCASPIVWITHKSGKYHLAASKRYGRGKSGMYACAADADAAGLEMASN
jgi:hypothetical protein